MNHKREKIRWQREREAAGSHLIFGSAMIKKFLRPSKTVAAVMCKRNHVMESNLQDVFISYNIVIIMEAITRSPGLQHISEDIFHLLHKKHFMPQYLYLGT